MSEPRVESTEGPLRIGSIFLSKYRILSVLGQGGHAWVYLAHEILARRDVAIKIVYRRGGASQEMMERGQREVQALSRIKHPHIVRLYSADLIDGVLSIVMEPLRGRTLRDVFAQHGRLEMEEMLEIVAQLADALHVAHTHEIIHRDVKPENIFICEDEGAKMIDFGVAKVLDAEVLTLPDALVGTIYYMSPQQLQSEEPTPSTDIYSLAVILYEGLAGRHPIIQMIDKPNASIWDVAKLIVMRNPIVLDKLDPRITRYVAAFASKGMSKKESQRHASALEFAAEARWCRELVLANLAKQGRSPMERDLARGLPSSGVKETLRSTQPVPSMMTGLLAGPGTPEPVKSAAPVPLRDQRLSPLPAQKTVPLGSSAIYVGPSVELSSADDAQPAQAGEDCDHAAETAEAADTAETAESDKGHGDHAQSTEYIDASPAPDATPMSASSPTDATPIEPQSPPPVDAPAAFLSASIDDRSLSRSRRDVPRPPPNPEVASESHGNAKANRLRSFGSRRLRISRSFAVLLAILLGCDLGIGLASLLNRAHAERGASARKVDSLSPAPRVSVGAEPAPPAPTSVPQPTSAGPLPSADALASIAPLPPPPSTEAMAPVSASARPAVVSAPAIQPQKRTVQARPPRPKAAAPAPSASTAKPVRPWIALDDLAVSSGLDGPPIAPLKPAATSSANPRFWIMPRD
ncbi:MAG: protein kinase domain-containing protein [Myxococcota bacterium]